MSLGGRKGLLEKIIVVLLILGTTGILVYNHKLSLNEKYENEIFLQTMELGNEEFEIAVWNVSLYEEGIDNITIRGWKNNGIYYLFLPKSWMENETLVIFNMQDSIEVAGIGSVENGEEFRLSQGSHILQVMDEELQLEVMYSSEIGNIFIETSLKNMAYLHESKENSDRGEYIYFDNSGNRVYGNIESFYCRGNYSFEKHEKKSYTMRLEEETDLLGGGSSKKWLLISNDADATLMRNMFVDRMGRVAGIDYMPDMDWIDLYIDGEYYGNYLLSEKIDIAENSVDIYDLEEEIEQLNADEEYKKEDKMEAATDILNHIMWSQIDVKPEGLEGGYLLELELPYRYPNERSGFRTTRGQSVVIASPTYATYDQVNYVGKIYQEFEDAVYSETGYNSLGKHYEEYIDLDSFVKHYLIDEITKQLDAAKTSSYMFKRHDDSKFVAGPLWDYDKCIYSNHIPVVQDPTGLFAATEKDETVGYDLWYGLYQQEKFRNDMKEEYWNSMKEISFNLGKEWIPQAEEKIKDSAYMNYIRWHLKEAEFDMNIIKQTYQQEVEIMSNFLFQRIEYLDSEWEIK